VLESTTRTTRVIVSLWTQHALISTPGGKRKERVLNGQDEFSMRKHFFTTIKMGAANEKKYEKWREAVPHHTGPT
jgi:hypothetical protein